MKRLTYVLLFSLLLTSLLSLGMPSLGSVISKEEKPQSDSYQESGESSTSFLKYLCISLRMIFRECIDKNVGVAGYTEAFICVLSGNQTCDNAQVLSEQCTSVMEAGYDGMAPDIARILERGRLVVAIPSTDTPLFFESDGNGGVMGFDAELAKNLAESLGVEVEFDRTADTFTQLTDKLKHGEVDVVISTYSMTPERAMYVNFSEPYLETYLSVMVGKQQMVQNKIDDNPLDFMKANPVKIGVVDGTAHCDMVCSLFPNADIVKLSDYSDGYDRIISGEIFAFLSGELEFLYAFESNPVISIYASVYSFTDLKDQFCVGVSRDDPQLLNFINAYIRTGKMVSYDEVAEAYKERFGGDESK